MSAVSRHYIESFKSNRSVTDTSVTDTKVNLRRAEEFSEKVNWPLMFLSVLLVGLVLILIVYLCECAKLVNSQYQICQLKETRSTLASKVDELEIQVQKLSSLERINNAARKELGMVDVQQKQKIVLRLASSAPPAEYKYYGFVKLLQTR